LYPYLRESLNGDGSALDNFVQEVRHFTPFTPLLGAEACRDVDWQDSRRHFLRGRGRQARSPPAFEFPCGSQQAKAIAGGGAGGILSGGLSELLKKFQEAGQGQAAESWIGTGTNQPVAEDDLEKAIGADTLDTIAQRTGIPRERLLQELREMLPSTVDAMTPDGRIPDAKEAARWG
jgi:uncharacterized protein YidB (DUF937 family)